jgi:uncharacterized membrane protein YccC
MTTRFQTAFKIALSMTIAYGVALSLNWENPHWAGFSIAFCSLMTSGESLEKGLLRTFGTFGAVFISLTLLALFPQDRWIYALCVSVWVSFCTWMMFGNARWYFWFCAGLGVPVLSMLSGGESLGAFQVVVLRAQETILGTLVFTFVSSFVFPTNSRAVFEKEVALQIASVRQAFLEYRTSVLKSETEETELRRPVGVLREAALRQGGLLGKLNAAALDSFDISETRASWRRAVIAVGGLVDALERWRLGLEELDGAEPTHTINGLEPALAEILRRFEAAADLLAWRNADAEPRPVRLALDEERLEQCSAFHRASLSLTYRRLIEIETASRQLLFAAADVRGIAMETVPPSPPARAASSLADPERAAGTIRVFAAFWLSFLAIIYVPDLPATVVLLAMTTAVSMLMILSPTLPLWGLAKPIFLAIPLGGAVHILIMPHLTGFAALAAIIFSTTFGICWICHRPQQAMGRSLGLAFFVILIQVENLQTYSFTFVANLTTAFLLVLGILLTVTYFPISFRPEKVFLRLFRLYCVSAEQLLETLHLEKRSHASWFEKRRRAYYVRQLAALPGRMAIWTRALPDAAFGRGDRASMEQLVASLAMLGDRVRDLMETRDADHSKAWVRELLDDVRGWRFAIQCALLQLAENPEVLSSDNLRHRLAARMQLLEAKITEAIGHGDIASVSAAKNEALYGELGGFRGVSESLLLVIDLASKIDWPSLREARL